MSGAEWQRWPWITDQVVSAGQGFARSLRMDLSGTEPVPGLEWTTGKLGNHVASMLLLYQSMLASDEPLPFPEDFDALLEASGAAVQTMSPTELAELIEVEVVNLATALGPEPDVPCSYYIGRLTPRALAGIALTEMLVHRRDLAGVTGERVSIERSQALAAWQGLMPAARFFIDQSVADELEGTYHLSSRGGSDWTIAVNDKVATVEPGRPAAADVRCSADPVAMLLMTLGRIGQLGVALRGKVVIYGRRPWLAAPFSKLFLQV